MANKEAILQKTGQIQSTAITSLPPLIVASNIKVDNLNADMVDGLHDYELLRSNADSTLIPLKTLSVNGEIKINSDGKLFLDKGSELTLGWFKVNMSGSLISINYNPS